MESKDEKNEDYDFDFSQYEGLDSDEDIVETIEKLERPSISGYKSRFSMGESEMERIADLRKIASKYAIQVEARVQDIGVIWKYFGVLSEIWEMTRNIYGEIINKEMTAIRIRCKNLMEKHNKGSLPTSVHNNLLYFRSQLYRLHQLSNLSLEVEKVGSSRFSRAKNKIIE